MVALWNRAYHYIFALWFLLSFFFFFPRLLDVCHTSTHGVALVRISDAGLKRAARGSLFICFLLWNELLQFWQRFQRRTFADNHSRYVNMSHAVPNDQTAVIVLREVSYHWHWRRTCKLALQWTSSANWLWWLNGRSSVYDSSGTPLAFSAFVKSHRVAQSVNRPFINYYQPHRTAQKLKFTNAPCNRSERTATLVASRVRRCKHGGNIWVCW